MNVKAANVVRRTVVADTKTAPICPTLKPPTAIDDDKDELSTDRNSIFFLSFFLSFNGDFELVANGNDSNQTAGTRIRGKNKNVEQITFVNRREFECDLIELVIFCLSFLSCSV